LANKLKCFIYCFPAQVRSTVADFAVFLSVTTWTFVDYMIGVDTPKLNVPSDFKPTRDDRWLRDRRSVFVLVKIVSEK